MSFLRKSGENDQLFGSVTSGDIAEALEKKSFHIDRRKIQLHEPLKSIGEFTVPIKLHKDVTTHLKVVIGKEATRVSNCWFGAGSLTRPGGAEPRLHIASNQFSTPKNSSTFFKSVVPRVVRQALHEHPSVWTSSECGYRAASAGRDRAAIGSASRSLA